MPTPEELLVDLQPAEPWPWRKIRRGCLIVFILFVSVFEWAMHRPWGEVVPGVRLEPLRAHDRSEVKPGEFADLLEQAFDVFRAIKPSNLASKQSGTLRRAKCPAWNAAEYPELDQRINQVEPALILLEQASLQSLEKCFIPKSDQNFDFAYGNLESLILLSVAKIGRCQGARQLDWAEALILMNLRLRDRYINDPCSMGRMFWDNAGPIVYQAARTQSFLLQVDAGLEHLASVIQNEGILPYDLAEHFRREFSDIERSPEESILVYSGVKDWASPFAAVLGSTKTNCIENCRVVYSHIIAAIARDPENPIPSAEILKFTEINPRWKNWARSDPVTRIALNNYSITAKNWLDFDRNVEAHRRLTLAIIAIFRHKLKTDTWPETLAAAMPKVPLDPFSDPPKPVEYKLDPSSSRWEITTMGDARVSSNDFVDTVGK